MSVYTNSQFRNYRITFLYFREISYSHTVKYRLFIVAHQMSLSTSEISGGESHHEDDSTSIQNKSQKSLDSLKDFVTRAQQMNIPSIVQQVNEKIKVLQKANSVLLEDNRKLKNDIDRLTKEKEILNLENKELKAKKQTIKIISSSTPVDYLEETPFITDITGFLDRRAAKLLKRKEYSFIIFIDADTPEIKRIRMLYEEGRDSIFTHKDNLHIDCFPAIRDLINHDGTQDRIKLQKAVIKVKFDITKSRRKNRESVKAVNVRLLNTDADTKKGIIEMISIPNVESSIKHGERISTTCNVTGSLNKFNRLSLTSKGYGFIKRSNVAPIIESLKDIQNDNTTLLEDGECDPSDSQTTDSSSYLKNSLSEIIAQNEIYVNISEISEDCLALLYKKNTFSSNGDVYVKFDVIKNSNQKNAEAKNVTLIYMKSK